MKRITIAAALFAFGWLGAAHAVVLGQVDTFESGTTEGWAVGLLGASHPAPPQNIASGGPAGADDNFLRLTSVGGGGAGSKMAVVNFGGAWAGDYVAAGVTGIRMDLRNSGASDLVLRLAFENPTSGPPTDLAVSTAGIALSAGGEWTSVLFPVAPATLTAVTGTSANALTTTTAIRLYHATAPVFPPGDSLVATLDVDNVTAVPEPATWALWLVGGLLCCARARRPR